MKLDTRPSFVIALFIAILFSIIVSTAAKAQVCPQGGPTLVAMKAETAFPACAPKPVPGATGTYSTIRSTSAGVVEWHYCTDGFSWKHSMSVVTWPALMQKVIPQTINAAVQSTDPTKSLQAASLTLIDTPLSDPSLTPIWCPSYQEMMANKPAPIPYVVASNGKYTTRPTYPYTPLATPSGLSLGTMSNTSDGSITTATACDCIKGRVISGTGSVYCLVKPASVTLCKKV